jgi:hypothetical protein
MPCVIEGLEGSSIVVFVIAQSVKMEERRGKGRRNR